MMNGKQQSVAPTATTSTTMAAMYNGDHDNVTVPKREVCDRMATTVATTVATTEAQQSQQQHNQQRDINNNLLKTRLGQGKDVQQEDDTRGYKVFQKGKGKTVAEKSATKNRG